MKYSKGLQFHAALQDEKGLIKDCRNKETGYACAFRYSPIDKSLSSGWNTYYSNSENFPPTKGICKLGCYKSFEAKPKLFLFSISKVSIQKPIGSIFKDLSLSLCDLADQLLQYNSFQVHS